MICMAESLHFSPETITTLFTNQPYSNTKEKFKKIKSFVKEIKPVNLKGNES